MTKTNTKRALVVSILSLLLCASMLIGTTFAWFTDSVESGKNIIRSGNLDVEMQYAQANENPASANWKDASKEAIFNYDNWEPGYVDAKHVRVINKGTLALNWQMRIVANGAVSKLANVIDVYYFADATQLDREDVEDGKYLGTLTEVLGTVKNMSNTVRGSLEADTTKDITIAFKMKESAGNEYESLSIGADFSVQIIATQKMSENDSFGPDYDENVTLPEVPAALVTPLEDKKVPLGTSSEYADPDLNGSLEMDVAFQFLPTQSYDQSLDSDYRNWVADYVVYADNDVPANSMVLAGYYSAYCDAMNGGNWVAFDNDEIVKAGTEIRLVELMTDGSIQATWELICLLGNDGIGFQCGVKDNSALKVNEGTTLTVELRLYEVDENGVQVGPDAYINIATFEHTFGGEYTTLEDGTVLFMADDGDVVLYDTQNVEADEYYVPYGVTELGDYSFTHGDIKEVVLPDTVESLGRAFDGSYVESVVLNEGLETIDSRAFRATYALKEVVIPSSVKTIADNAFQKSYIKEIVIPATVETIGETAFGASKIESVTFEGNTSIQGYAFRGCPNLRTVIIYGDDVEFISSTLNGRNSMWFCNGESNNANTSNIDFHVVNETMKERVLTAMGAERNNTDVFVDIDVVMGDEELSSAIAKATEETATILLSGGTYTADLDLTVAALGNAQSDTIVIKAVGGADVVFTGITTLGYRNQGTGAAMYNANVVFEGITFDATNGAHALEIGDVKSLTLKNCTIIGNGEYGIHAANGNATGPSKIIGCTFENAAIQGYGNFCTGLVIEDCTFNDSRINIQGGNSVTVQNCTFNNTLTEANVGDSFYAIRSNSTPVTVKNCEINIDSELTKVATSQAKWYLLANRGTTNWTVENVSVNLTDAALIQTELDITACTSTGVINATNLTVNGIAQ